MNMLNRNGRIDAKGLSDRPRSILLYIHELSGGGAERVWAVLASALAGRGHRVTLAVDRDHTANQKYLDARIRVVVLGRSHAKSTLALAKLLRTSEVDVAISATAAANLKLALAKSIGMWRRPIIISYHGFWEDRTGWLGWASVKALPLLSRFADRTIAVSDGLRRYLVEQKGASATRTIRVYNPIGVVATVANLTHEDLAARKPMVLTVGRLIEDKDVSTALKTFAALARPDAELVVLGDGPCRSALEAEAKALGIAERVHFEGYVETPWPYYARARCLLHTAQQEAFGNIIVEALAYGLPIVATDCSGPHEILDGGRFGHLAAVGDVAALTAGLRASLADPGDPEVRMARAQEFSTNVGARQYEATIETILAERNVKIAPASE